MERTTRKVGDRSKNDRQRNKLTIKQPPALSDQQKLPTPHSEGDRAIIGFIDLNRSQQTGASRTERPIISRQQAACYIMSMFQELPSHSYGILYLGKSGRIIQLEANIAVGLSYTSEDIPVIVQKTLMYQAASIVICEKQPPGFTEPDLNSESFSMQLNKALHFIDIELMDRIVIGDNKYYSFRENDNLY